jgi:hypothetical protein
VRGAARGRVLYPDTVAGAKPVGMDLVVGRVGEGGPCARMPDSGARNRLAAPRIRPEHAPKCAVGDGGEVGTVRLAD